MTLPLLYCPETTNSGEKKEESLHPWHIPVLFWKERKKINWAFARETAFSQARSMILLSSRLLYDGLTSLLGSARSDQFSQERCFLSKSIRNSSRKKCTFSRYLYFLLALSWFLSQELYCLLALSWFLSKEIAIYIDPSLNLSILSSSIRIDMSPWATMPVFSYMFWPRPFPLQRRRFRSFNLMSWGMWPMLGP